MRWSSGGRDNIEDARGRSGFGMGGGVPIGIGGFVVLLVLSWATGTDFLSLLGGGPADPPPQVTDTSGSRSRRLPRKNGWSTSSMPSPATRRTPGSICSAAVTSAPRVVLFRDAIQSAAASAEAATGPFYCPGDHKVYLDLAFFNELSQRFGAPGDFAQAYVVAHEFGHHVQNLLGTERARARDARHRARTAPRSRSNCRPTAIAGVWGHAASQGGRFQAGHGRTRARRRRRSAARGRRRSATTVCRKWRPAVCCPRRFTHGTSAQRIEWFQRGMQSGDPRQCDTFGATTH